MKKFVIYILICYVVIRIFLYFFIVKPEKEILEQNYNSFIENVRKLDDEQAVELNELTDFEWDTVYDLVPYLGRSGYERYTGKQPFVSFPWYDNAIGFSNILFTKNGKAVCHVVGWDISMKLNSCKQIDQDCRIGHYEDNIVLNVKNESDEYRIDCELTY